MFWKKPTVQDLLKLYASMTDEEKAEFEKGKQDTAEQAEEAEEKVEAEPKDDQTERDRVDESVAAQEKAEGDEDSQTAKDRIDESEGMEKADKEKAEEKPEEKEVGETMDARFKTIEEGLAELTDRLDRIMKALEDEDFGSKPEPSEERADEGKEGAGERAYYSRVKRR